MAIYSKNGWTLVFQYLLGQQVLRKRKYKRDVHRNFMSAGNSCFILSTGKNGKSPRVKKCAKIAPIRVIFHLKWLWIWNFPHMTPTNNLYSPFACVSEISGIFSTEEKPYVGLEWLILRKIISHIIRQCMGLGSIHKLRRQERGERGLAKCLCY